MENYVLCGELSALSSTLLGDKDSRESNAVRVVKYKGRRKGTIEFCGIWKHSKSVKDLVANGVRIMHSLDHRNVLRFFEWYETPKHIWVITELASGGFLADILEQDESIPPDKVGGFISDIASGLKYLHSNQICYCDLQPNKVMLDTCECLKLSDFTLARSTKHHHAQTSEEGFLSDAQTWFLIKQHESNSKPQSTSEESREVLESWNSLQGPISTDYLPSPFYAAPELFVGSKFSEATDMWSLGCVIFEMLVGRQPFCATSFEALRGVVSDGSPSCVGVDGTERDLGVWSELVCGLLHKKPGRRCSWIRFGELMNTAQKS